MEAHDFRPSIIITSFNHRAFLTEAIESVLAQTLPAHEIIIADDASSDGSQETIRDYERRYPGFVKGVFQNRNAGIPKNRNAALRTVTGNYVGILDGDDLFLPHKLELQFAALSRRPDAKVVYGNFGIVDPQRRPLAVKWRGPQPEGNVIADVAKVKTGLLRTLIADYEAVKQAGFMDERFPKYDGLWLSIKLALTCRFAYVDDILIEKREHLTSDSKTITQEQYLHDLTGMHNELMPLLPTYVGPREIAEIDGVWRQWISRHHPTASVN